MTLVFDDSNGAGKHKTSDSSDTVDGRFVELVPPRRVVQEFDFVSDDPAFSGTMTMAWTLQECPEGTRSSVAATKVPAGISAEDHRAGLESSLSDLAAFIERKASE